MLRTLFSDWVMEKIKMLGKFVRSVFLLDFERVTFFDFLMFFTKAFTLFVILMFVIYLGSIFQPG